MNPQLLAALILALVVSAVPAQTTWTVDDDGPADFSDLQPAVQAAGDGDTLLVREGYYQPVYIDGKGLTIVGQGIVSVFPDAPGLGSAEPALVVQNLAANQAVALRGMNFFAGSVQEATARIARFENCAGPILLEDCRVAPTFLYAYPMEVDRCGSVTLVRCDVSAASSFVSTTEGMLEGPVSYHALVASESQLAVYDSEFVGSWGREPFLYEGQAVNPAPGSGAVLRGCTFLVSGSTFRGGDSLGPAEDCLPGADGASALVVESHGTTTSSGTLLDSVLIGGDFSISSCGAGPGSPGLALEDPTGAVTLWPGPARRSEVNSPVMEGAAATLSIRGVRDDLAILLYAPELVLPLDLLLQPAVLSLGQPLKSQVLGAVPASGSAELVIPMPQLPPGLLSRTLFVQVVQVGVPLALFEGGPSVLTVIDASL